MTPKKKGLNLFKSTKSQTSDASERSEFVDLSEGRVKRSNSRALSFSELPGLGATRSKQSQHCVLHNHLYKYHKKKFLQRAAQVGKYWKHEMVLFDTIEEELRFPIFPEKTEGLNNLSGQLWLTTFALQDFSVDIEKEDELKRLSQAYFDALTACVKVEGILKDFTAPLSLISETGGQVLLDMKKIVIGEHPGEPLKIEFPPSEAEGGGGRSSSGAGMEASSSPSTGSSTKVKTLKAIFLSGSRIEKEDLFDYLKIYFRTIAKRKWFPIEPCTTSYKFDFVCHALGAVTSSLNRICKLLKPLLRSLVRGTSFLCPRPLTKTLGAMSRSLSRMSGYPGGMYKDEIQILTELRRTEAYVESVLRHGRSTVQGLLEVGSMTRLCYTFVTDWLEVNLPDVGVSGLPGAISILEDPLSGGGDIGGHDFGRRRSSTLRYDFVPKDFYKTRYPDILRKVPVVIRLTEFSLHKSKQGSKYDKDNSSGDIESRSVRSRALTPK